MKHNLAAVLAVMMSAGAACASLAWPLSFQQNVPPATSAQARVEALQRAANLIQQHDIASAETTLELWLKRSPEDAIALNLLGLIRLQQQDRQAAEKLFRQAINQDPAIVGPHINLASLYGAERPLDALAELSEALKLVPDSQQAQTLARSIGKAGALNATRAGENDKALAIVLKARSLLPNEPDVLYDSGMVLLECDLNADAEKAFEQALKQRPGYDEAVYGLARAYLGQSHAKQAEEEMRTYLKRRPKDASAYYGLGYILMAEQQLDEARAAFEESLMLQPNQTESEFQLGEIAVENGEQNSAREHFSRVLSRDPHHAGALTEMGIFEFRQSDYLGAEDTLKNAIASGPSYQKAHYYYALTLKKLGDNAQAERQFEISRSLQKSHGPESHLLAPQ